MPRILNWFRTLSLLKKFSVITGIGGGIGGYYYYKVCIPKIEEASKEYFRLVDEMNSDNIEDGGTGAIFRDLKAMYAKKGILEKPLSTSTFIGLTKDVTMSPKEKQNIRKLYLSYYASNGLYNRIFKAGKRANKHPMLMMNSEDGKSCKYAKVMTYLVASEIAAMNDPRYSTLPRSEYKDAVSGRMAHYSLLCDEYMKTEPECTGFYLEPIELEEAMKQKDLL